VSPQVIPSSQPLLATVLLSEVVLPWRRTFRPMDFRSLATVGA
jgi:hypothetical protein